MKAWIARDENDDVYFYTHKPYKCVDIWTSNVVDFFKLPQNMIRNIDPQWTDDEPVEIELEIKLKK